MAAIFFYLFGMLRTIYRGSYINFAKDVESKDLLQLQKDIENAMGDAFHEYESAWIFETSPIGRKVGSYFYSLTDYRWHFLPNSWKHYNSWSDAMFPVKQIMQFVLDVLGYRAQQESVVKEALRKSKIDDLYG